MMAEEMHRASHDDLLPGWQRIAWMAAIWFASVSVLGAVSWAIRLWLAP